MVINSRKLRPQIKKTDMENLIVIGVSVVISSIVSILWVRGIDRMHKNHPDYKGEDLFE